MVSLHFSRARDIVEGLVDEGVKVCMDRDNSDIETGDLQTVAQFQELPEESSVDSWDIKLVGMDSDTTYAKTIYYNYEDDRSISLFDWVGVHPDYQGNGIGGALIEETIKHIEAKTPTENIFLKLEEPMLRELLINIGFYEIQMGSSETWLER